MDEQKSSFYKNLSFWNLIFFITLTIAGLLVTKCLQDKVEKLEIENRAQLFRPKIELKDLPKISRIIFTRDTNWIRPDYDINIKEESKDTITDVIVQLQANFSFTLENNSEQLADIGAIHFFLRESPKIETVQEMNEKRGKEILIENIIQLDYKDTSVFNFNDMKIGFEDADSFYIHFVVFYLNQFVDMYESYFIFKCKIGKMPIYRFYTREGAPFDFLRIGRMVMKDRFIQIEPHNKFTYYLNEDKKQMIVEENEKTFKKLELTKEQSDKILKNNEKDKK